MNILVKAPENLQDVVLFIPSLKKIKAHYESVTLIILANQQAREILSYEECYDKVYPYQSGAALFKSILFIKKSLKKYNFDYFISFDNRVDLSWYGLLKRIPIRICDGSSFTEFILFNKRVGTNKDFGVKHEVYYNLDLLKELGLPFVKDEKLTPDFKFDQEFLDQQNQLLQEHSLTDKNYVFVELDEGANWPYWSSRNFARLMLRILLKFPDTHFVVYGDEKKKTFRESFQDQLKKDKYAPLKGKLTYFDSNKTSLKNTLMLLKQSNMVIGHNSAMSHIKNIMGGKVISFFNPIRKYSALRLSPFKFNSSRVKVVLPQVICGETYKCSGAKCPYHNCMSKLVVDDVFKAYEDLESV